MTAIQIAHRAREINDQNRRMTMIVVALGSGVVSALIATLIWI